MRALDRLRQVSLGEEELLRLLLVGLGTERELPSPLLGEASNWVCATPFLATRYPKRRGSKRDRPEDYSTPRGVAAHVPGQELARLRERRPDMLDVLAIEPLEMLGPQKTLRPIQFDGYRQQFGNDGGAGRPSGAFRIRFATPMKGLLCLGPSCHWSLGLFIPEK